MAPVNVPWRVLVLGCGSAGRRWIELCRELGLTVLAYDTDPVARKAAAELGATPVRDIAAGLRDRGNGKEECDYRGQAHGVIVATWPTSHIELALRAVRASCHVLIEKPLSHSLDGVDDLIRESAARPHLAVGVVCNLRYHPTTQALRKALADTSRGKTVSLRLECGSDLRTWRKTPYTQGYGPWKDKGGGVALDAIHELDLACHLLGPAEQSAGIADRTGELDGDSEDVALFSIRHQRGRSQIHLDYVQKNYSREAVVIGVGGRARLVYEQDPAMWRQSYLANLKAWIAAASGAPMPNPVSEAAQTLRIALGVTSQPQKKAA